MNNWQKKYSLTTKTKKKIIDKKTITETLMCFKRAGANAIITYFADKIASDLK